MIEKEMNDTFADYIPGITPRKAVTEESSWVDMFISDVNNSLCLLLKKGERFLVKGEGAHEKDQWRKTTDTTTYEPDFAFSEHIDHAIEHLCQADNDIQEILVD